MFVSLTRKSKINCSSNFQDNIYKLKNVWYKFNNLIKKYQKIPKNTKKYQKIPENTKTYQKIPKNTRKYQNIQLSALIIILIYRQIPDPKNLMIIFPM